MVYVILLSVVKNISYKQNPHKSNPNPQWSCLRHTHTCHITHMVGGYFVITIQGKFSSTIRQLYNLSTVIFKNDLKTYTFLSFNNIPFTFSIAWSAAS